MTGWTSTNKYSRSIMLSYPVTDVFFDLDHTLWDFERNSALTYKKIFSTYDIRVSLPEFLLEGDGTQITLPVEVRNEGNVAVPSGQKMSIQVMARPTNGGQGGQGAQQ